MVKVKEDMTGWKMWEHGVLDSRLTVIEQTDDYIDKNGKHISQWLCECNCNNKSRIIVTGKHLRSGQTKSCGCISRKTNNYVLNLEDEHGLYGIGYCSNTGREFYFDMDDYDKIKDYCWYEVKKSHANYYEVKSRVPCRNIWIKIHYLIIGKYYDHVDRNTFNNRKYNLREMTQQENVRNGSIRTTNTSGFIGVSLLKNSKWRAYIVVDGKQIHLGSFKNKEDAVYTRLQAELKYFGKEFAPQRHLFEEYNLKV